jgi:hypothetical protein
MVRSKPNPFGTNTLPSKGLKQLSFKQLKVDECVFFRGTVIFMVYTDDGIFALPDSKEVDKAISEMKTLFNIDDQGDLKDYLSVNVEKLPNGDIKLHLTQHHLINQIITKLHSSCHLNLRTKQHQHYPPKSYNQNEKAPNFDQHFHYQQVIGQLNFLEKLIQPNIAYAVHQVARFCQDPKVTHAEAIKHITKYLHNISNEGIILHPQNDKSFDVFANADFVRNWHRMTASDDLSTAKSRSGWLCHPVCWLSYCMVF